MSKMILEIGVGTIPWMLKPKKRRGEMRKKFTRIEPGSTYICLDDLSLVESWDECLKNIARRGPKDVEFKTITASGVNLPFENDSFDLVIMSDVLSIPAGDWCQCGGGCECGCTECDCSCYECEMEEEGDLPHGHRDLCCGKVYHGISQDTKNQIIKESFRVLKNRGQLLLAQYSTPANCFNSLTFIESELPQLYPLVHLNRTWVNEWAGDTRGAFEKLYRKNAGNVPMSIYGVESVSLKDGNCIVTEFLVIARDPTAVRKRIEGHSSLYKHSDISLCGFRRLGTAIKGLSEQILNFRQR